MADYGVDDLTKPIDFNLLRSCILSNGRGKLIWEIDLDGYRIKKWTGECEISKFYNLPGDTIGKVCYGKVSCAGNRIWEFATPYLNDNTDIKKYRVIPLSERVTTSKGGKQNTLNNIEKYDLSGTLIKKYENIREYYKVEGKPLSLSYIEQYGFIFQLKPRERYGKGKREIKQLDLSGNLIKIWDIPVSKISLETKICRTSINSCLNNKIEIAGGNIWEYGNLIKGNIKCDCGSIVVSKSYNKHLNSSKHKNWLNKPNIIFIDD